MRKTKPPGVLTLKELCALLRKQLGLKASSTSIYYYLHHKNLPVPFGFSKRRYWRKDEIDDWIAAQLNSKK